MNDVGATRPKCFSTSFGLYQRPASIQDPSNIKLIVTGIEVVIRNCFPEVRKMLPDFKN